MHSLSIVIPNYNGKNLLKDTLSYLYDALDFVAEKIIDYEIIIPDDCSTDDSITFLEENYPNIIIVENKKNQGFAPNINVGIKKASKELVFLLNSDVRLCKEYFSYLLPYFESKNDEIFGVSGRVVGYNDEIIQDASKYINKNLLEIGGDKNFFSPNFAANIVVNTSESTFLPTFFLSGSNALIKREKLMLLNGFDENFAPFYAEDVEISLRAWRMGWFCAYEHTAICRHQVSSTINKFNKLKKIRIISRKNKFISCYLHLSGKQRVIWYLKVVFDLLVRWIYGKFTYYSGFWLFLKYFPSVLKNKKAFENLQEKYNKHYSNQQIVTLILEKIEKLKIIFI